MSTSRMDFASAARDYVSLGWKVVALTPGSKTPRAGTRGVHDATADPEKIATIASNCPTANIAVAAGASGLIGIDVDVKNGSKGMETLAVLVAKHGPLPAAPESVTRSGGKHLWFSAIGAPQDFKKRLPGIDIIAGGVMLVAPPSIIVSKMVQDRIAGQYVWTRPPLGPNLPPLPAWFWKQLERRQVPQMIGGGGQMSVGSRRLEQLCSRVARAAAGERDHLLYWAGCRAAEGVALGYYTRQDATRALYHAGIGLGQTPSEVARALRGLAEEGAG
jgi:hypothetical protein